MLQWRPGPPPAVAGGLARLHPGFPSLCGGTSPRGQARPKAQNTRPYSERAEKTDAQWLCSGRKAPNWTTRQVCRACQKARPQELTKARTTTLGEWCQQSCPAHLLRCSGQRREPGSQKPRQGNGQEGQRQRESRVLATGARRPAQRKPASSGLRGPTAKSADKRSKRPRLDSAEARLRRAERFWKRPRKSWRKRRRKHSRKFVPPWFPQRWPNNQRNQKLCSSSAWQMFTISTICCTTCSTTAARRNVLPRKAGTTRERARPSPRKTRRPCSASACFPITGRELRKGRLERSLAAAWCAMPLHVAAAGLMQNSRHYSQSAYALCGPQPPAA